MAQRRFAVVLAIDVVGYSRMMSQNASGLLAALNKIFRSIVRPTLVEHNGRIVKLMGDGALFEFSTAHDGLGCAIQIQNGIKQCDPGFPEPISIRAGLCAGDVLVDSEDLFGDCVNIAARLQAVAEPGGILISRTLADLVGSDFPYQMISQGVRSLKNIARPMEVLSVVDGARDASTEPSVPHQEVRYCRTVDGVSLAWTATGTGAPVVKAPNWITHLELDWRAPQYRGWMSSISTKYRLIRYDSRGNGMSDLDVDDISFERFIDDLERVFDAAGIERAPIFSISQGCAMAVAFAARAPERVSGIIMMGGYVQGRAARPSEKSKAEAAALKAMVGAEWDDPYPSLRDLMAERIIPLASVEEKRQFAEDMRAMIPVGNMMLYRDVVEYVDVSDLLDKVTVPCLVLHCRGDRLQPIEQGQALAAGLANARFVGFESPNHVMTDNDPCWPAADREIHAFLAEVTEPVPSLT